MNRLSKIFQPYLITPKGAKVKPTEITSKSQKLLIELGFIKPASNGILHLLPLGQKAIDKCIRLVEKKLKSLNAQKVTLPILTPSMLWKKSGRLDEIEDLLIVKDRHGKEYLLSPTHEEAITDLLASNPHISYKNFPLRLYQIGYKFRDELKPKFGLIRTKEFLMKDLYTFDTSMEEAEITYEKVKQCYENIFETLKIPWLKVNASTGMMGGHKSHEYHILASIGEDNIIHCKKCSYSSNDEVCGSVHSCPKCGSDEVKFSKGIEIAHTFLLGEKYSKVLGATFLHSNGKPKNLFMGSFGIGVTRLVAASLEALSNDIELRWPFELVPFKVCIIPPKDGSKEFISAEQYTNRIYAELGKICDSDSILLDDRTTLTIGKRLMDCKKAGYPFAIIIGKAASSEQSAKFELHNFIKMTNSELDFNDLISEIRKLIQSG